MHRKTLGIWAIIAGLLFPVILLVGGGFVTATNASYWCGVFGIAYAIGLVFPGILVYLSAKKQREVQTQKAPVKMQFFWVTSFMTIAVSLGSSAFFKSDFFASSVGKHAFTIIEAVFIAQMIPLGLGWYFSDEIWTESPAS
jgi:hypothetical protein